MAGPPDNAWAPVIWEKRLKVVRIEQVTQEREPAEYGDDTVLVRVEVDSELMPQGGPSLVKVNELARVRGEWKIFSIY